MSATSFYGGAFYGSEFYSVAAAATQGGGTSKLLPRGRIPRKYADIDLQAVYRAARGDPEPPQELLIAAQDVAEGIAGPTIPQGYRDELLTLLLPFIDQEQALDAAEADAIERMVDWRMMVQDREAMQMLIQLQMDIEDDDDEDTLLLTVH